MKCFLSITLTLLLCLATFAEEQIVRKFRPGEFTATVAGITAKRQSIVRLENPKVTKTKFGFRGTVDYDKVEVGGLHMYVSFKGSESYLQGMMSAQPKGYQKTISGSAKGQPFFITLDSAEVKERIETLGSIELGVLLPHGGSITVKSLELVQW